jgi:hypothetical protein
MKVEAQIGTPPDVEAIVRLDDQNEVNTRIKYNGWVLLGILYTRDVDESGSFADRETYIIGLRRGLAR